jgi:hypothetical protein
MINDKINQGELLAVSEYMLKTISSGDFPELKHGVDLSEVMDVVTSETSGGSLECMAELAEMIMQLADTLDGLKYKDDDCGVSEPEARIMVGMIAHDSAVFCKELSLMHERLWSIGRKIYITSKFLETTKPQEVFEKWGE